MHQSHVKGITFDPANKFFATAGDDRSIKIFRFTPPPPNATQHDMINNFVLEATISAPFKSSPLTTYFRRCSWSPDGHHIAAANAVNGPVPSVAIIDRSRWESDINLIGHEAPTEVCSFSPRLFYTKKPESGSSDKGQLVTVIASAGQDKTLSIWNTNTSRPVVIVQDVASKSVSDLAWTPDGQTIFASSLDGSVVAIKFEEGELGYVADSEENDKALQKYGAFRKGMGTAEDVDSLHLENHSKAGELRGAESRMGALMGDFQPADKNGVTTNGAKSATASKNGELNGTSDKQASSKEGASKPSPEEEKESAEKAAARIAELKSRVQVTKDGKKRVAPLLVSSSATGLLSLPQSQLVGAKSTKPAQNDAPQTILDLSKPFHGLPRGGIAALLLGNKRKAVSVEGEEEEEPAAKRPSTGGPVPIMVDTPEGLEPAPLTAPPHGQVPTPEYLRPAVVSPAISVSQVRLAVPKVRSHIVRPLERGVLQGETTLEEAAKGAPENIILEARNPVRPREPSRITATKRGALLWQDFLPRAVLLVTGSKYFWAAACEDGSLHTWTPAGRRLFNAIILESQPVILECRNHWLLCITSVGLCHVFNVKTMSAAHPPVSLAPILDIAMTSLSLDGPTAAPGVTSAHLNSNGNIVVTLSNGDGFFYSSDMYTWQRLSESWWAVGSQYWNSNDSSISALSSTAVGPVATSTAPSKKDDSSAADEVPISAGIIPYLERHTTTEFLLKGRAYTLQRLIQTLLARDGFEGFESAVSVAHLENRIAGALALGAKDEFRLYLFMYAKRIGAEGMRGKVEELLNALVGGILREKGDDAEGKGWASKGDKICGWDRKELLKGVVLILGTFDLLFHMLRCTTNVTCTGKFRDLHRLTVQYARILGLTAGGEENGNGDGERMELGD